MCNCKARAWQDKGIFTCSKCGEVIMDISKGCEKDCNCKDKDENKSVTK